MTNEVRVISYIIGSDSDYYNLHHFTTFSVPTADTLFLLMYNEFAENITKESDPTISALYTTKNWVESIFLIYFENRQNTLFFYYRIRTFHVPISIFYPE